MNTTNLLEYEYRKYHVNTSEELEYQRNMYEEERKARRILEQANSQLMEERKNLLNLLQSIKVRDTAIWLGQCEALVDPREMVEIRHDLNQRRQSLRKRIEYNEANRDAARNEINSIVKDYPEYGNEILTIVSSYGRAGGRRRPA